MCEMEKLTYSVYIQKSHIEKAGNGLYSEKIIKKE